MLYIEAKMHREAIEMYNKAARWADSYRVSAFFLVTMEFMLTEFH